MADLVEAEGRALRKSVLQTGAGLAFMLAGVVLLLLGVAFCLWGLYTWIAASVGSAAAAALIGAIALVIGGGLVWFAIRLGH